MVNLTGVAGNASTYLSVFPTSSNGQCNPTGTSSINLLPGAVAANRAMVELGPTSTGGPDDAICVYNAVGSINVLVDVNGVVRGRHRDIDAARLSVPGARSHPHLRYAVRVGVLQRAGRHWRWDRTPAAHFAWREATASPQRAKAPPWQAIVANLTGIAPTTLTYLALYPANLSGPPGVSDLNLNAGAVLANMSVASVDTNGDASLFNAAGSVNAIVDLEGWFQ